MLRYGPTECGQLIKKDQHCHLKEDESMAASIHGLGSLTVRTLPLEDDEGMAANSYSLKILTVPTLPLEKDECMAVSSHAF